MSPLGQRSSLIFNPGPDECGLKLAAKRYIPRTTTPDGLTLLFAHNSGGHKEEWEPTLEEMLARQNPTRLKIREVWSVDWQSHGEAGRINAPQLENRGPVSLHEWAYGIAALLRSEHLRGHRVVGIGQSTGSSALVLATQHFPAHTLPFSGIIIVEPIMASREYYRDFGPERDKALGAAIAFLKRLETRWSTRDAAFEYMRGNFRWKSWDPRVLRIHVDQGLYESPTGEVYCNNQPELSAYQEIPPHLDAVDQYRRIAPLLPIHYIFGGKNSFASPESQQSIFDPERNIQPSSTQRIQNARHLVVQENPTGLASAICIVLETLSKEIVPSERSRL
ncbi:alpha/beta-hydrolase [Roridomyces roridus]|uniref:Alpha/beta-hydrolase n=1 Tax=Roridomyces roridus TaxID=1738132 RepID=A0AAD7B497_9AGAR|nr:alpha/beta-hydrolase [Roridomyces roridus]